MYTELEGRIIVREIARAVNPNTNERLATEDTENMEKNNQDLSVSSVSSVAKNACPELPEPTRPQRGNGACTARKWRRNDAQMTHKWRAINEICARPFAQGLRSCMKSSVQIFRQLLAKALAEALQAMSSSDAAVDATSLAKLFGVYARGLQTLCRDRSIMRQNVS
ncbi:MAG: hypothetical protein ABSE73_30065, partial [Planctomycetota bacterium]